MVKPATKLGTLPRSQGRRRGTKKYFAIWNHKVAIALKSKQVRSQDFSPYFLSHKVLTTNPVLQKTCHIYFIKTKDKNMGEKFVNYQIRSMGI
ncbi:hypothetical protein [Nostoc sp.]|uniref:hypothetical protein n=1 Tax=Nostoc sp. TaxID=1180 RepID=UPI002FF70558